MSQVQHQEEQGSIYHKALIALKAQALYETWYHFQNTENPEIQRKSTTDIVEELGASRGAYFNWLKDKEIVTALNVLKSSNSIPEFPNRKYHQREMLLKLNCLKEGLQNAGNEGYAYIGVSKTTWLAWLKDVEKNTQVTTSRNARTEASVLNKRRIVDHALAALTGTAELDSQASNAPVEAAGHFKGASKKGVRAKTHYCESAPANLVVIPDSSQIKSIGRHERRYNEELQKGHLPEGPENLPWKR